MFLDSLDPGKCGSRFVLVFAEAAPYFGGAGGEAMLNGSSSMALFKFE